MIVRKLFTTFTILSVFILALTGCSMEEDTVPAELQGAWTGVGTLSVGEKYIFHSNSLTYNKPGGAIEAKIERAFIEENKNKETKVDYPTEYNLFGEIKSGSGTFDHLVAGHQYSIDIFLNEDKNVFITDWGENSVFSKQ